MIRVNVVAEGQSEMYFVQKMLSVYPFSIMKNIEMYSRAVLTSKDQKTGYEYRGGLKDYKKPKRDIIQWLKESPNTYVTTMFDLYRLPNEFPGYQEAMVQQNHYESVSILERELKKDILLELPNINPNRFIPYIQLHEFEALFFVELNKLKIFYLGEGNHSKIDQLIHDVEGMNPELINHGANTAPSKRLKNTIPYAKGDDAVLVLQEIGITAMLNTCQHFSAWVNQLLNLSELRD